MKHYATFESFPAIYDDAEAWVLFAGNDWRKLPLAEVLQTARPMSEDEFHRHYPRLPPIPSAAFHSGE
jgi:hypothetical protein